jgi:pimeloyl-ACP methyl ester carboxylesterase
MKALKIDAPNGAIATRESEGDGPAVVLIHGNSSSSRIFSRQLDGPLGRRFRLVAIDLPGHGLSEDARDPCAYSLPGHGRAVKAVVDALGLTNAHFVGWSLGGHVLLEMAPDLPEASGFVILGTPPISSRSRRDGAFLPHPTMGVIFNDRIDRRQAGAYAAAFFRPSFADAPPFILEDLMRTDGRAQGPRRERRRRGLSRRGDSGARP